MTLVRRLALIVTLAFALGATGCIIHSHGHRRAGSSCGKNKVWVKHKGKLKCKHRHFKRGHKKHKGKGKGVKRRDHRGR